MDHEDSADWQAYCDGSDAALNRIYERRRGDLLKYCFYLSGSRETAAEVVQETFLRLIQRRGLLVIESSLKNWLFICARNLCFNQIKARKPTDPIDSVNNWSDGRIDAETKRFISEVLGRLDPEELDLILMREQQQYTVMEIAEHLGISTEAVRMRMYRVRKKMQEIGAK